MKTRILFLSLKVAILTISVLILGCSNLTQDDLAIGADDSIIETPWYELIEQFDSPSIIVVSEGSSIQDAINVAISGDAIYIEPGLYTERISFKSSVKLFGMNDGSGKAVVLENSGINSERDIPIGVEVNNIQFKGTKGDIFKTSSKRKSEKSTQKFITMNREELAENVAYYTFDVRLGHDKYERVTLHRLVKENTPYRPEQTLGNIFMIHGASQNFEDIYLIGGESNVSSQSSSVMYLAAHGIDVWGISLGWTRVPAEETDFSFMKDWGVERDVEDVLKSMSIARVIRGITKQGFGRMNLLGFSYSVNLAYVAAGHETQEHWVKRDINGLIPIDGQLKFDPQETSAIQQSCNSAIAVQTAIENGIYQNKNGVYAFGQLAAVSPNDPSPIIPGFTNFQAALFVGTNTYNLLPLPNAHWHFVAGSYDNGIPIGLAYTSPERWIKVLAEPHAGPYMPQRIGLDLNICQCNNEDSTLDDHLTEIEVPVFYIGSGGGVEAQGFYTVDQLKSQDITKYVASLNPEPTLDFGHGDLFLANNADSEVWEPIRQWLLAHH